MAPPPPLPPHPLKIPEILLQIARFIPTRSLPTCARVSRVWHKVFVLLIWQQVKVQQGGRQYSLMSLWKHRRLIKTLELEQCSTEYFEQLHYPILNTLVMTHSGSGKSDPTRLIEKHSSLTRLSLNGFGNTSLWKLWDTLLGFSRLSELKLSEMTLGKKDIDQFWQLCTRLERVDISQVSIPHQGNLLSFEFPRIKEIRVSRMARTGLDWFLEWIQHCSGLITLHWSNSDSGVDGAFVSEFTQLLAGGTWRDLNSLSIRIQTILDENLFIILESIHAGITRLDLHGISEWSDINLLEELRPHMGQHLRELCVGTCKGVSSSALQVILSSCPLLEKLWGSRIDAVDVIQGSPWVCLRLEELSACFRFNPGTIAQDQPLVFEQLARLTRLRGLHVGSASGGVVGGPRFREAFDLRLESGLDALSTLRSLRTISFGDTEQRMGEQEINWIMDNWWGLEEMHGELDLHRGDKVLEKQLRKHGIVVKPAGRHSCSLSA